MNDTPASVDGSPPEDYPAELERVWLTPDGTPVTFRALRPDDLDRELAFIKSLSGESLHLRRQYASGDVSREDATQLLKLDYRDTLAVGALVPASAGDRIVGVSRYARTPGSDSAECAIVVADDWQGRGIGSELMRSLAVAAVSRGIRTLEGTSLGENRRIRDWAKRFGFAAKSEPNSGGLVTVTLDLASFPEAP